MIFVKIYTSIFINFYLTFRQRRFSRLLDCMPKRYFCMKAHSTIVYSRNTYIVRRIRYENKTSHNANFKNAAINMVRSINRMSKYFPNVRLTFVKPISHLASCTFWRCPHHSSLNAST